MSTLKKYFIFIRMPGKDENIKILLKNGADVNAKNKHNKTALHFSSEQGFDYFFSFY